MTSSPERRPVADKQLVELALDGDQRAFRELFDRYYDTVIKAIDRVIGPGETVNDLMQETFEKAFAQLKTYQTDRPFSPWLYTIARRAAIDWRKRRGIVLDSIDVAEVWSTLAVQAVPATEYEDHRETPEESALAQELGKQIDSALDQVRRKYAVSFLYLHYYGFTYEEIADIWDISLETARQWIHRGRRELQELLREQRDDWRES